MDPALGNSLNPVLSENLVDSSFRPPQPYDWTVQDVSSWLADKGFEHYIETFAENHINGQILLKLDKSGLEELVPSLGHRLTLLDEIESLRVLQPARHIGEGVVNGLNGLATKLVFGLHHLVSDPLHGMSKGGVTGLVKGLGSGITGAISSPIEGVVILSKELGDGFRHTPTTLFGNETDTAALSDDTQQPLSNNESAVPNYDSSPNSTDPSSSSLSSIPDSLPSNSTDSNPTSQPTENVNSLYSSALAIERMKPQFLKTASTNQPLHIGSGVVNGLKLFGGSVYDGITGIITEPMKASTSDDLSSLAIGFAKGVAGAICKPVAGTFDLANQTVEGLLNTPTALIQAVNSGPSIQETPTAERLLRIGDSARQMVYGASPSPTNDQNNPSPSPSTSQTQLENSNAAESLTK